MVYQQVLISKEYLQLEPIGLVFVFFFALILVIQFTAMMFHRFGTLSHILASTELNLYCGKKVTTHNSYFLRIYLTPVSVAKTTASSDWMTSD
jgi:chitin synthase